jgi:hypothetical protein
MLDVFAVSVVMIRMLAIWIIVNASAAILPAFALSQRRSPDNEFGITSPDIWTVLGLLTYPVLAAVLLIFSTKIGRLVTRGLESTAIELDQNHYPVLHAAMFSVLGAYVLVYSVPELIIVVVFSVLPALRENEGSLIKTTVPVEHVVGVLLKTLFGVVLLLGWKRILASIRSMWKKGISVESID